MARQVVCPRCGTYLAFDFEDDRRPTVSHPEADRTVEVTVPHVLGREPDLGFPDPSDTSVEIPTPVGSSLSDEEAIAWISPTPPPEPDFVEDTHDLDASMSDVSVASLTLSGEAKTRTAVAQRRKKRGPTWGNVLLRTYASLMTAACFWLIWHARNANVDSSVPVVTDSSQPLDSQRGAASRFVQPSTAIAPDNLIRLKQSLRVGAIEFVPVTVTHGPVELERTGTDGKRETKDGGINALILHVKVKNLSADRVFAPLDEAFVRDSAKGLPESYIEDEDGTRIYMYRLPVAGEWSISGQRFREIKPGEVINTFLVTDAEMYKKVGKNMTWRMRLRTGADATQTELVGVKFDKGQIQ